MTAFKPPFEAVKRGNAGLRADIRDVAGREIGQVYLNDPGGRAVVPERQALLDTILAGLNSREVRGVTLNQVASAPDRVHELIIREYGGERGVWGEHPDHPRSDWKIAVESDATNHGYWEWVACEIEVDQEDEDSDE